MADQNWIAVNKVIEAALADGAILERPPGTADEVMWHVTQHDVTHAAQIVQLIRALGSDPPSLDLAFLNSR